VLVVFALIFTACEVALDVNIDVNSDGGGTVQVQALVDEEAAAKFPTLATEFRADDLVAAGWNVSTFQEDDDGNWEALASKRFANSEQLDLVLNEITGDNGMFSDFRITQDSAFAERSYGIDGVVDLRRGERLFGDTELIDLLGGEVFGRPLDFYLEGQTLSDAVPVTVTVSLPGEAANGASNRASWQPRFDDSSETRVGLTSVSDNFAARLLRWIATAAFLLFGLSILLGLLGYFVDRRNKRRAPARRPGSVMARVPGTAAGVAAPAMAGGQQQPGAPRQFRLVCMDPLGVLYDMGGQPGDLLVSFIRSRGSNVKRSAIDKIHREAMLGRVSSAEFWEGVGMKGKPNELDEAYVELIEPRAGAAEFLREMRRREVPVTCITNDHSEWSRALRERDNLAMVWPWIISADTGVMKPDPGIYEALRREAGVPYEACLLIDVSEDHLTAARTLGMSTVQFATRRPGPGDQVTHPVVTSFADFFRRA